MGVDDAKEHNREIEVAYQWFINSHLPNVAQQFPESLKTNEELRAWLHSKGVNLR
jgi:hypothetical protein